MINDTTRYIMPLLFNNKFGELVKESNGFINAFISDKNKPQLCNNIFLMYKSDATKIPIINATISKNKYYHHNYSTKINDEWFIVFVFIRPINQMETIDSIIKGVRYGIPFCSKVMIQRFWEYRADSIEFNCLFNSPTVNIYITPDNKLKPVIKDEIQEEDPPIDTLLEQFGIDCIE